MAPTRNAWSAIVRSPLGATALVLMVLVALTAILGPVIWGPQAEQVDPTAVTQGPSAAHLLGTDTLGRDVLARVLVATRLSVVLAVIAVLIGVIAGSLLGMAPRSSAVGRTPDRRFREHRRRLPRAPARALLRRDLRRRHHRIRARDRTGHGTAVRASDPDPVRGDRRT